DCGHKRNEIGGCTALACHIRTRPTDVNAKVAALYPPGRRESLLEGANPCQRFLVVLRKPHQNADPPHAPVLLRPRRQRPSGCASDERDEFSPSHGFPPAEAPGALRLSHPRAMSVAKQQFGRRRSPIAIATIHRWFFGRSVGRPRTA